MFGADRLRQSIRAGARAQDCADVLTRLVLNALTPWTEAGKQARSAPRQRQEEPQTEASKQTSNRGRPLTYKHARARTRTRTTERRTRAGSPTAPAPADSCDFPIPAPGLLYLWPKAAPPKPPQFDSPRARPSLWPKAVPS